MADSPDGQVSFTDPGARSMATGGRGSGTVGYNVQAAVDTDRGYYNSPEILSCEEAGCTVTLPKPMTSGNKAKGRFVKADFRYVPKHASVDENADQGGD